MRDDEMAFPETWREFADWWSINDSEQIYSNGVDFLPMHRVEQMMEHYYEPVMEANKDLAWTVMTLEKDFADWIGQYDPTDTHVRMLQEENTKLYDRYTEAVAEAEIWNAQWEAEHTINSKLRDIINDYDKMLEHALAAYHAEDAPLADAAHTSLRSRLYNLGFEVE
jgi:hypothetical protein